MGVIIMDPEAPAGFFLKGIVISQHRDAGILN
jgi:hypothetical protein